jgi:hypothetical protein
VEELSRLQQVERVKSSPQTYLQTLLANEFGEENAHEAMQHITAQVMDLGDSAADMVQMEALQEQLRSILNSRALVTLRATLDQEIGVWSPDLVNTIMNDWNFIGVDIKYNRGFLSAERIALIVDRAKTLDQHMEQLDAVLEGLSNEIRQGMPISEELIERRYSDLEAIKKAMPQAQRDAIRRQFVGALTAQEGRKLGKYNGSQTETDVLSALGYDLERYSERRELRSEMLAFLTVFSANESAWRKSIPQLKAEINEHAFQMRMDLAGVLPNHRPYIKAVIRGLKPTHDVYTQRARELVGSTQISQIEKITSESTRHSFYRQIRRGAEQAVKKHLTDFVRIHRDQILQMMQTGGGSDAFQVAFGELVTNSMDMNVLEAKINPHQHVKGTQMRKQITWFGTYGQMIERPFRQSGHDALGDGVCLAYSHRLCRTVLFNPDCTLDELGPDRLTREDRNGQAASSFVHDEYKKIWRSKPVEVLDVRASSIPTTLSHMQNTYPQPLYLFRRDKSPSPEQLEINARQLASQWIDNLENLRASNGAFNCLVREHAIPMCIDVDRGRYWISDPNFGLMSFPCPSQGSQTADEHGAVVNGVIHQMALCMEKLVNAFYENTEIYIGTHLLVKNPQVPVPESSYAFVLKPQEEAAGSSSLSH